MRIDSSTVGMESTRRYQASNVTVRRFSLKEYRQSLSGESYGLGAALEGEQTEEEQDKAQVLSASETTPEDWYLRMNMSLGRTKMRSGAESTYLQIQQHTIRYIFDLLFAQKKGRFQEWMEENGWSQGRPPGDSTEEVQGADSLVGTVSAQSGFSANLRVFSYAQETIQYEREDTSFFTTGTVCTGDGREISFRVNVGMSREFQRAYREELNMASFTLCDPLVINLDTDVAQLSDQNIFFDIDADGETDEVARLAAGSGYLALDKNGDGVINDGSELFGTRSGNGFADLAAYDEDRDGWIDEDDSIWSKLQIWCQNEKGESVLYRLAEKGVGAICLTNASTDFTLQSQEGDTRGVIRNSGVFLYENGEVGTVQHVDVAKYQSLI